MKRPCRLIPALLMVLIAGGLALPRAHAKPREIVVGVILGQLKYDIDRIQATPGETIAIRFENKEEMPHNLVICDRGTDIKTIADAAIALGADGMAKHYVPESPKILAATPLVMQNKHHVINFKVPKQPGEYPYVCTFPGHSLLMNGILQVGGKKPSASALHDLKYKLYEGNWTQLPDFSKLKPVDHGLAKKNLVDINGEGFPSDGYAVLFTGTLRVPKTGKYEIRAGSDDGGRIIIDGKTVWEDDKIHGVRVGSKKIKLTAGDHPVEIQYFEGKGNNAFVIDWKGPGMKKPQAWSTSPVKTKKGGGRVPALLVAKDRPVIYRNFFGKAPSRGIGIGYPEKVNALFDANYCRWRQLWRGDFVDAGVHWTGRGQGVAEPAGNEVVELFSADPAAVLTSRDTKWPARDEFKGDVPGEKSPVVFAGYDLDPKGRPTMFYRLGEASFAETLTPKTVEGTGAFDRVIKIDNAADGLHVFLGRDRKIEDLGKQRYRIGEGLTIQVTGTGVDAPEIRANDDGFDLFIPIKKGAATATITETIQW